MIPRRGFFRGLLGLCAAPLVLPRPRVTESNLPPYTPPGWHRVLLRTPQGVVTEYWGPVRGLDMMVMPPFTDLMILLDGVGNCAVLKWWKEGELVWSRKGGA